MGATSSTEIMKGKVYVSTSTPVQDNRITEFVKRQELWGHKQTVSMTYTGNSLRLEQI